MFSAPNPPAKAQRLTPPVKCFRRRIRRGEGRPANPAGRPSLGAGSRARAGEREQTEETRKNPSEASDCCSVGRGAGARTRAGCGCSPTPWSSSTAAARCVCMCVCVFARVLLNGGGQACARASVSECPRACVGVGVCPRACAWARVLACACWRAWTRACVRVRAVLLGGGGQCVRACDACVCVCARARVRERARAFACVCVRAARAVCARPRSDVLCLQRRGVMWRGVGSGVGWGGLSRARLSPAHEEARRFSNGSGEVFTRTLLRRENASCR